MHFKFTGGTWQFTTKPILPSGTATVCRRVLPNHQTTVQVSDKFNATRVWHAFTHVSHSYTEISNEMRAHTWTRVHSCAHAWRPLYTYGNVSLHIHTRISVWSIYVWHNYTYNYSVIITIISLIGTEISMLYIHIYC